MMEVWELECLFSCFLEEGWMIFLSIFPTWWLLDQCRGGAIAKTQLLSLTDFWEVSRERLGITPRESTRNGYYYDDARILK